MAQNAKPAAAKPGDPTVPKSSKKSLFIIIGVILAVAGAGAGGWFFAQGHNKNNNKNEQHEESHSDEYRVVIPKPPIFFALEPFTVNLKSENNDQYLQIGISLKFYFPEVEGKLKLSQPEIRSKILQLLTTKTAAELLTYEGKKTLAKEITMMANPIIGIMNTPTPQPRRVVQPIEEPASAPHEGEAHAKAGDTHSKAGDAHAEAEPNIPISELLVPEYVPPPKSPYETNGVIDVLFTSFIIQ